MDKTETKGKNLPEKRFSTGAIQATVWNNEIEKDNELASYKTISISRRYKDKEGVWKSTNSLRVNDLPKAVVVLNEAYKYLVLKEAGQAPTLPDTEEAIEEEIVM